ncbi:hypothetical protein R75461_07277 [Paraburkholderia nemoris]|uniref:hypothetical protein n=1 Tax=Paraburkholderia nemoris TaxID=2793076 RepID=UPI0019094457|nr:MULTISPECIES: hypothetical protein [Paraburkholderia]MBK3786069.1 hypothetical protein [Paraburkholderia aspalathi]CAE6846690.1 hypothetical protein R75461_07277 [Paraburkholderia nemoris]
MYLTDDERQALLSASVNRAESLDQILKRIRRTNPDAFHTDETLSSRVFYDEPMGSEPCRGFVRYSHTRKVRLT